MRSYTGWYGSADYLINDVSQSFQSFGWHDNARSYNSAHGWWLLPCHQIVDIIPGVSEREYCNRAGNFDVERTRSQTSLGYCPGQLPTDGFEVLARLA